MNFNDVLNDIKQLIGLTLNSIRPGSDIVITDIDVEHGNLTVCTSSNQFRSRPIDELKKIWNEMMIMPAVHVDGVLHGSGTSRNQPETILANLPYVEWLKIDNKKHIAYVIENTHAYGTLKQMDPIKVLKIVEMTSKKTIMPYSVAIASNNIEKLIFNLNDICQGVVTSIKEGVYQFESKSSIILLLSAGLYGLDEGTYCILKTDAEFSSLKRLVINNDEYLVSNEGNVKVLIHK